MLRDHYIDREIAAALERTSTKWWHAGSTCKTREKPVDDQSWKRARRDGKEVRSSAAARQIPLDYDLAPAETGPKGEDHQWAEPRVASLRAAMRWVVPSGSLGMVRLLGGRFKRSYLCGLLICWWG